MDSCIQPIYVAKLPVIGHESTHTLEYMIDPVIDYFELYDMKPRSSLLCPGHTECDEKAKLFAKPIGERHQMDVCTHTIRCTHTARCQSVPYYTQLQSETVQSQINLIIKTVRTMENKRR